MSMKTTLTRRDFLKTSAVAAVTSSVRTTAAQRVIARGPFQPAWESLTQHYRAPEWFRDAKYGLFIHWGLSSVPAGCLVCRWRSGS